jgi:hypothetical protein
MTSFAILMPAQRPAGTVPVDDNRTIQVRTRRRKDLEILRDEFMGDELGPTIATPQMDYNFRAYCTPQAWARACYDLALEVDFEKFKPTTESKYDDADLHSVYNSIWSTVTRLGEPGGAWAGYGSSLRPVRSQPGVKRYSGDSEIYKAPKSKYVWDQGSLANDPIDDEEVEELVKDLEGTPVSDWKRLLTDAEWKRLQPLAEKLEEVELEELAAEDYEARVTESVAKSLKKAKHKKNRRS